MTIEDLVDWLWNTFKHYSLSIKRQGDDILYAATLPRKKFLIDEVRKASRAFSLPAIISQAPLPIRRPVLEISMPAAQIYLQRALKLEPTGTFPFLRLPPELRDVIYHMMFRFPPSGIELTCVGNERNRVLRAVTKDTVATFSADKWMSCVDWSPFGLYKEPIQQTLSLLLVNKQIFKEAFSHFYRENVFYFASVDNLGDVLRSLPRYRRQHLTQIAFRFEAYHSPLATRVFRYLASLPNLRKLYIEFDTHAI
jgi:hypothetical protein